MTEQEAVELKPSPELIAVALAAVAKYRDRLYPTGEDRAALCSASIVLADAWNRRSTVEAELKAMTAERDEAAQGHEDQVHSLNRQIARIMAERDSALAEVKRLREAAHAFLAWIHPESMEPGHGAWPLVRQFRAALSPLPPAPSQNKEARP